MSQITKIIHAIEAGDPHAAAQLLPLVYDELRRLAAQRLAQEKPGQTLELTRHRTRTLPTKVSRENRLFAEISWRLLIARVNVSSFIVDGTMLCDIWKIQVRQKGRSARQ